AAIADRTEISRQDQKVALTRPRPPSSLMSAGPRIAKDPQIIENSANVLAALPTGFIENMEPTANQLSVSRGKTDTGSSGQTARRPWRLQRSTTQQSSIAGRTRRRMAGNAGLSFSSSR